MSEKTITVFGSGRVKSGDTAYSLAYKTGKLLAEAGFAIANGGYGGTMLASAKGAFEVGGKIIGVTCSAFAGRANKYINQEIITKSLDERLHTLVKLADGYMVFTGGTGTLLEFALVWEFKNKGFLKSDKSIILVGEFWKPLVELVAVDDPESTGCIHIAAGAEEARNLLLAANKAVS